MPTLFVFSDIHTSTQAARAIVAESADADLVVGAGDFANMRKNMQACIDVLKAIDKPTVLVAGNGESAEELRAACKGWAAAYVLHGSGVTLDGVEFFGVGGGIPITPFGTWSFDFSEEQAEKLLAPCPPHAVLVTHSPPYGVVDVDGGGIHKGSTAIREAILRTKPQLVVCGHIHACAGTLEMLGETPVINAGPVGMRYVLG